ncbi:MAG TPA: PKD domain-containing protein, partial [Nitrosopumilaceae archaeon]|nr:PKD domain-containing protein [Nitrosopumilaceae archaeon]
MIRNKFLNNKIKNMETNTKTNTLFQGLKRSLATIAICIGFISGSAAQSSCVAGFTRTITGNTVAFTNTSTTVGPTIYTWNFGDGTSAGVKNPTHTYIYGGTYHVCLNVYDSLNNSACSFCDSVIVSGPAAPVCHANFTHTASGTTVSFSSSPGSYSNFSWNFNDGTTSTLANPTHTFVYGGTHLVCFSVYDSLSNSYCSFCDTVNVTGPAAPVCNATFTHSASGSTANFTSSSGTGFHYYW